MTDPRERAYRAARYRVQDGDETVEIRIGKPNLDADALLVRHGVAEGVLVTAWNPGSANRSVADNEEAGRALQAELDRRGLAHLPHASSAPDGGWREPGFLVLGMAAEDGLELACDFGQAAIVHLQAGLPAALRFTGL